MFQNINEYVVDSKKEETINKKKNSIFSKILAKDNIALYIVALMISLVNFSGEFSIFSISMLGASIASSVPILGIIIVSFIGNLIKYGVGGALEYILTALVMIVTLFIFKPKYNEQERNEKIKIGKNIIISTIFIQIIKFLISSFTMYDILLAITISIIALVFYKIFVNSIIVIQEFYTKRAFSIEEIIGASLLIAISVGAFGEISVLGLQIKNIINILIVMILGWKNGILVGTTSGVTIGVTVGVITGSEPIIIAAYAISGMVAGILNRFGKIGVIVGFALGNVVLAYVSNGYTIELIHFKEILVASIGLLALPKTLQINIEEFIGNSKLLPVSSDRALNKSKEMVENLNNVSEAIQKMAETYKNIEPTTFKENTERNTNKQIFIGELLNTIESYKDNILYEDIADTDGKIIDKIFDLLVDKQEITNEDLLNIFANCNSYIVGFDNKEISDYLETNISQMVRNINVAYKVSKSNFIWKKRVEQNKKSMEKQLKGVSKAIHTMAQDLEKGIKKENKFSKEEKEILDRLEKINIETDEISIKKESRFFIEIYTKENLKIDKIEKIEKILTDILKERIILNAELTLGKKLYYLSDDKYRIAMGTANETKSKSKISGDNILSIRLKDGKYLIAISDGMGSGEEANKSSEKTLKMLRTLLLSGFDNKTSLDLINTTLINQNNEIFATLDIAIIDLYKGNIEFIKSGACPTYIKNNKKVQIIKSNSLPAGIIESVDIQVFDKDIENGDIMLMCSDGILDSNIEYKNKELWLKYMLEDIETNNTQKIADIIINEAIDNNFGVAKDDMSIIICKFIKKEQ